MIKKYLLRILEYFLYLKSEIIWKYKINKIYKHLNINNIFINKKLINDHKKLWGQLKKNVNPKWFLVYSNISENPDINYVPENIYHNIIESRLNNRKLAFAYRDKNFYELFYDGLEIFPETILRNIDGFFYDKNYEFVIIDSINLNQILNKYKKIIIKPSIDSGGGKNIMIFKKINGIFYNPQKILLNIDYLKKYYKSNFIIQNYIEQNNILSIFNPTSVNTIRFFTYRSVITDDIIVLHLILRIGKKGHFIDDQNYGGIACRIKENFTLDKYATDKWGNKYYSSNGITFKDFKGLPKIEEMKKISSYIAKKNIHSRLMGFDFTLDINDNIKLIEINNQFAGINFFQMNSSSVFGKYTDEIIQFCKNF